MLSPEINTKVLAWTQAPYNFETQTVIKQLIAEQRYTELTDAFYQDLEFGTGGLRGLMGQGTNRMNNYTVGAATQGFANYLNQTFPNEQVKVAIAYDSRNNSKEFAQLCADIFSANDIKVHLFSALRPTPLLSFCVRHLACHAGVVLTASHNPKEYNGYKAYWNDGSQLVSPHDKNVISEIQKVQVSAIQFTPKTENIHLLGQEIEHIYYQTALQYSLSPQAISEQKDLKIVYTPIHGTGITLVPDILHKFGFTNVHLVQSQAEPDGNFPTVAYPNPEEAEAMQLGLNYAKKIDADILLGTDPDADRVGIAVKNHLGKWQLLNGNQTGVLLLNYLMERGNELQKWGQNAYIAKTIVTSELIDEIALHHNITCFNTLTGFKYIAAIMRQEENKMTYIGGCEESYGYLIGDFVRDKDAILACALIAEMTAYAKSKGKTAFETLLEIYQKYHLYHEKLVSITRKGKTGAEEIQAMMKSFRENPPTHLAGSEIIEIRDYQLGIIKNIKTNTTNSTGLETSNVLQFITANGAKVSARPSGTEPKIKFYFSLATKLTSIAQYDTEIALLEQNIQAIIKDLAL